MAKTKKAVLDSDETECRVMCKNLRCLQDFLVTYNHAISSYHSSGKLRCPLCDEHFEFNPLELVHIVKEGVRRL